MLTLFPKPEVVGQISFQGQRAHCIGALSHYDAVVYLSIVGFKTANRALWAALMEPRNTLQIGHTCFNRMSGAYLHDERPLAEIGMSHMLLLHHQASVQHNEPDKDFYIVGADPQNARFFTMLNRAVSLPMLSTWAPYLWRRGVQRNIISSLDQDKAEGWIVEANSEQWQEIIQQGIQAGELQ